MPFSLNVIPDSLFISLWFPQSQLLFSLGFIGAFPVRQTPVNPDRLETLLVRYTYLHNVQFLVDGFSHGFDMGFCGSITPGVAKNHQFAHISKNDVSAAINKEVEPGHTVGPFSSRPFAKFHASPLGAVPKKMVSLG